MIEWPTGAAGQKVGEGGSDDGGGGETGYLADGHGAWTGGAQRDGRARGGADALDGTGGREGEEEPAARRCQDPRAGQEGGPDQLRHLSWGQGQGRRRGRGCPQSQARGLDVEGGAGRYGR